MHPHTLVAGASKIGAPNVPTAGPGPPAACRQVGGRRTTPAVPLESLLPTHGDANEDRKPVPTLVPCRCCCAPMCAAIPAILRPPTRLHGYRRSGPVLVQCWRLGGYSSW